VTAPLAGLTVVVTRPRRQAGPFIECATRAGATCIALPTLEIDAVELDEAARARLAPDEHDWVIYTSANAVEIALASLPRPTRPRVAAVGRATARALELHGLPVHALPAGRSDSEGLLALPAFAQPAGLRILILRGLGGRELLREQLQARGATVSVGEIYRRRATHGDPSTLAELEGALAANPRGLVVAVTSVEVLDGLLDRVPPALADRLRAQPLLLPGVRVAEAARERRWAGPLIVASSAEDASMLAALESHSGARRVSPEP
jgi:uroporphyrinogen-III synthase